MALLEKKVDWNKSGHLDVKLNDLQIRVTSLRKNVQECILDLEWLDDPLPDDGRPRRSVLQVERDRSTSALD